jgi:hypothetical protein
MGWVSDRMVETYSHTRLAAKQEALGVIEKVGNTDGGTATGKFALPERPVEEATAEGFELTSTPQRQIPNIDHPSIQAEIDRRVALALKDSRSRSRTSGRPLSRGLIRRRRLDKIATPILRPTAPNVVSFPGPRRA